MYEYQLLREVENEQYHIITNAGRFAYLQINTVNDHKLTSALIIGKSLIYNM